MENNEFEQNQTVIDNNEVLEGNDKLFAILGYFAVLWLIGLLVAPEKDHAFVKNHVNNGMILFICEMFLACIPFVGWALEVVIIVFAVMGIIAAATNKYFSIPVVGEKIKLYW